MEKKEEIGYSVGFAILIAIGLLAILNPSLADTYLAVGPLALVGVHTSD